MSQRIQDHCSKALLMSLAFTTLFFAITRTAKGQTPKRDYQYANAPLASVIEEIVQPACISAVIDQTAKDVVNNTAVDFQLSNATSVDALWLLFKSEHLDYDYAEKVVVVYKGIMPKQEKREVLRRVIYEGDLVALIRQLAYQSDLKATFDESLHSVNWRVSIDMSEVSSLRVLQTMLAEQGLTYEHTTCKEIVILPKTAHAFYWRARSN